MDGDYGPLYTYGIEYLKAHQPMWFVAENVSGLSSSNSGETFKLILNTMKKVGYQIIWISITRSQY